MVVDLPADRAALLIYDMTQNRVEPGERRFSQAAADGLPALARLREVCRAVGAPVCYAVGVRAGPHFEICRAIAPAPDDKIVLHPKTGAFTGTDLELFLRERSRDHLLLTGIALDYGVSSTAREALTLGLQPILVRDACFAYDIRDTPVGSVPREELERAHLATLHFMGARIVSVGDAIDAMSATS